MRRALARLYLIAMVCAVPSVFAQKPKTLDEIQKEESIEESRRKALEKLNELETLHEGMMRKRKTDCAKAVGYEPFCKCILEELPVAWSFADYVAITTKSKKENGYEQLKPDLRAAYDEVGPIRDKCGGAINAR